MADGDNKHQENQAQNVAIELFSIFQKKYCEVYF